MAQPPIVTAYAGTTPWKNTSPALNPAFTTFFPNQVNGLALWLDGNDVNGDGTTPLANELISSWVNRASTIYTCAQGTSSNAPTYNTLHGINFSNDNTGAGGSIQGFDLDYPSYNNNETIYTVVNYSNTTGSADMHILYTIGSTGRRFYIDKFNTLTTSINGAVVIDKGILTQNTTTLVNSLISPTQVTHYVDGTSKGSSNYSVFSGTGTSYLGFDNYLGSNCFNGTMYEVLIYSNVLADSDRYKIEAYLYQKWAFNLDPTNPYKISGYSNYNYPFINSNNFIGTKSFTFTGSIDSNSYTLIKNYYTKLTNIISNATFP